MVLGDAEHELRVLCGTFDVLWKGVVVDQIRPMPMDESGAVGWDDIEREFALVREGSEWLRRTMLVRLGNSERSSGR